MCAYVMLKTTCAAERLAFVSEWGLVEPERSRYRLQTRQFAGTCGLLNGRTLGLYL